MPEDTEFERRLRAALRQEADALPLRVDAAAVHDRMTPGSRVPGWLLPLALPVGVAVLVAAVVLNAFPGGSLPPGSGSPTSAPFTVVPSGQASQPSTQPAPQPTPHPAQRRNAAAAIAGNVAYLVGGVGERGPLRTATAFDTRVWTELPALPEPRVGAAGAVLPDGRLMVAGGMVDAAATATTLLLDPVAEAWTEGVPMPHAQAHMGVAVIGDRVFLFGGSSVEHAADVLVFDPAAERWTLGSPMPAAASRVAATAMDGLAWVFGGKAEPDAGDLRTASRYDPVADAWQPLADMPSVGSNLSATPVDGRIWVIGGFAAEFQAAIAVYDPSTNSWTQQSDTRSLPGQWHVAMPQDNGTIVLLGGWPFLNARVINTRTP